MKRLISMKLYVLALLLSGCASLGAPSPETFNERAAVALTAVTTVRETAKSLVTARKISPNDAQNVQETADTIRTGIDVARGIHRLDPKAGETKLASITAGLRALQTYLAEKGKP